MAGPKLENKRWSIDLEKESKRMTMQIPTSFVKDMV